MNTQTIDYNLDSADRSTTGQKVNGSSTGAYMYDALGRQTVIPASDTPSFGAEDSVLGYYVDDLPASVATQGMSTSFTLDADGRRLTQATTGGWYDGKSVVRHYTDESDNPSWEVTTQPGQAVQVSRFTEGLDGDLGAMITDTGDATINLVDPHDNNATGITIPAAQAGMDACTSLTGWSSYTEYGGRAVNWHWTDTTVSGPLGYGWLGGKQRSTSGETAAFTLMGVRYYNWMTGTFTGPDPVPGGNDTSYGYPNDPINQSDTTGQWGCGWCKRVGRAAWKHRGAIASVAAFAGCAVPGVGWAACGAVTAAAWAVRSQQRGRKRWRESALDGLITAGTFGLSRAFRFVKFNYPAGRPFIMRRSYRYSSRSYRYTVSAGIQGPSALWFGYSHKDQGRKNWNKARRWATER